MGTWTIVGLAAAWLACAFVGWIVGDRRANGVVGAVLGGLLGPLGWLLAALLPAFTRCPSCGRMTPYRAAPSVPPGASHPHLRCRRCGAQFG